MSKGDLTEAEWRVLKDLLPIEPESRSRGRLPEQAPDAFLADKGYDADAIRADFAEQKIKAVIPGRSNRRVKIEYGRALCKQRNRIERMFGHLKINSASPTISAFSRPDGLGED